MKNQTILPLFTVIIPVKNRGAYLEHTLRTCMVQDYPHFEIIVSDDASTDNTKVVVEKAMLHDARIKLFSHYPGLGMKDNFEFALNQVQPGYLIVLGGDDGLIPGCIQKMYNILVETKTELLTWPSPHFSFSGYSSEFSKLAIFRSKGVRIIKAKDFLKKVTKNLNYLADIECPMFYIKGVASTKLIDRIKSKSEDNCFYSCPTPDGYSGIVLAGEVEEYAFSGEPLSIGGETTLSQGRAYLNNDEQSKKNAESFFKKSRPMHMELASQPYSPLITLMTADYLLTARDLLNNKTDYPAIDYKNLIRKCFVELEKNFVVDELVIRELKIVKEIALQHDLLDLFDELSTSKRKVRHRPIYDGSVITPRSLIFDSKSLEINNIYDAAQATKFIYNLYNKFCFRNVLKVFVRIIKTYLQSRRYKLERYPLDSKGPK